MIEQKFINKDGLYVDNKLVIENDYVTGLSSVQIGSAEGATRSNATYNYIKVVAV